MGPLIQYVRICGSHKDSLDRTLYQENPGRINRFWHIGSTALYQVNPGRNHKFWHIGSTALYQGNPGRNHKF
jgi:hypothetical protein